MILKDDVNGDAISMKRSKNHGLRLGGLRLGLLSLITGLSIGTPRTIAQDIPVLMPTPLPSVTPRLPLPPTESTIPSLPGLMYPEPDYPPIPNLEKVSTPDLLERLRSAGLSERQPILSALGKRGKKVLPNLLMAIDDRDPYLRSGAIELLGKLGDDASPAVPKLIKLLQDDRRALFPAVSSPGGSIYYEPTQLAPILPPGSANRSRFIPFPPPNPRNLIKIYAIASIGQIGGLARNSAMIPVSQLLKDADPWVRLNAAWALIKMGADVPVLNVYLDLLQNPDSKVREEASDIFRDESFVKVLGAEATPSTVVALVSLLGDGNETVRDRTRDILKILGSDAVPALENALLHPRPLVRLEAIKTLAAIGSPAARSLPMLKKRLTDLGRDIPPPPPFLNDNLLPFAFAPAPLGRNEWERAMPDNPERLVRSEAVYAIAVLGTTDSSVLQLIENAARQDDSQAMRLRSIWALRKLGGDVTPFIPTLVQNFQNPDRWLRSQSLSLAKLMGAPARSAIVSFHLGQLSDPNLRRDAILALGSSTGIESLVAVSQLRSYLEGSDERLRGFALTVLANIANGIERDMRDGKVSPEQLKTAISEFSQVLEIVQKPDAKFNAEPIQRLINSLKWFQSRS